MNIDELQEPFQSLLARFPPESSISHALIFTNQVFTAKSDQERGRALIWLVYLLSSDSKRDRYLAAFHAKLWAYACTDEGDAFLQSIADDMEGSE
ncbi:MAG: hypothetical protein WCF57_20280 [Pyrinomonadaceae bacterium]